MSKNILWQNYSAAELRKIIREWPIANKSEVVTEPAKAVKRAVVDPSPPKAKSSELRNIPKGQRQKNFGADGEVKFAPHRELWLGFMDGRAVVKARTQEACQALLKKKFGIESPEAKS